jgi:S-adenosylmethionine-dependent methyltransferase
MPDLSSGSRSLRFEAEIYGACSRYIRLQALWEDLVTARPQIAHGELSILAAGGGAGHLTLRPAQLGNRVVLGDASREMLDRVEESMRHARVSALLTLVHAPIQALHQDLAGRLDLVVCHAVDEDDGGEPSTTGAIKGSAQRPHRAP